MAEVDPQIQDSSLGRGMERAMLKGEGSAVHSKLLPPIGLDGRRQTHHVRSSRIIQILCPSTPRMHKSPGQEPQQSLSSRVHSNEHLVQTLRTSSTNVAWFGDA
jgi:hypothetical protein